MNHRIAVVVLVLAAVVGSFLIDRADDPAPSPVVDTVTPAEFPIASRADAPASTWFCAGGTADEEAFADHVLAILNPTDAPVVVTIAVFAGNVAAPIVDPAVASLDPDEASDEPADSPAVRREPVEQTVEVAAHRQYRVALSEFVAAPIASALVEAPVGGLVVEHEVSSVHGNDRKPCATAASDTWHFAWGSTERTARELLVLFNPFPGDAIVDGRFMTEDGVREPVRFDGLVVPGRSTLAVDLGDDVTRRAQVAATLTTRAGRVVVDRILRRNEQDPLGRGLTVQLGAAAPLRTWVFPDGRITDDIAQDYAVYNPSGDVAEVELEFVLDRPEENGIPEPVNLSLAPGAATTVDLRADGRVPLGVGYTAIVRSANDVAFVVERVTRSTDPWRGISVTGGAPVEATEWSFAAGAATPTSNEWLVIANLDPHVLAEVDIVAMVDGEIIEPPGLQDLVVEAGKRRRFRLGDHLERDRLSIVVRSTEPVVVERGIALVGGDAIGLTASVGIPGRDGIRLPADPLAVEVDADLGDLDLDVDTGDDPPVAPDDVELPEPDETIVIDDPDAEVDPTTTTSSSSTTPDDGQDSDGADGVPDTVPAEEG